jgi:GNAT superfamily N-acetyltransferase
LVDRTDGGIDRDWTFASVDTFAPNVIVKYLKHMECKMDFVKISESHLVNDVLAFLAGNFFVGDRKIKFVDVHKVRISKVDFVTVEYLESGGIENVELWACFDSSKNILGAMTLDYFLWEKLASQSYFNLFFDEERMQNRLSVNSIKELLQSHFAKEVFPKISIELGYFSVDRAFRGQGIGRKFYKLFIERAKAYPLESKLVFTIAMGKYAKTQYGNSLIEYVCKLNANTATSSILMSEVVKDLDLPSDIFALDENAIPTAELARKFDFRKIGYGRYLGEVWARFL